MAAQNGHSSAAEFLLARGAEPNGFFFAAAAKRGYADIIKRFLLTNQEMVTRKQIQGKYLDYKYIDLALIGAAAGGHVSIPQALLEAGANPATHNIEGYQQKDLYGSAIDRAVLGGSIEMAKLLMARKQPLHGLHALQAHADARRAGGNPVPLTREMERAARGEDDVSITSVCKVCCQRHEGRFYRFHYGRFLESEEMGPTITRKYACEGSGFSFICHSCAGARSQVKLEHMAWSLAKSVHAHDRIGWDLVEFAQLRSSPGDFNFNRRVRSLQFGPTDYDSEKRMLLASMSREYASLRDVMRGLSDGQMNEIFAGTWSVKQMTAHLSGWLVAMRPRLDLKSAEPKISYDDDNLWNVKFVASNEGKSLEEVLQQLETAHRGFLGVAMDLPAKYFDEGSEARNNHREIWSRPLSASRRADLSNRARAARAGGPHFANKTFLNCQHSSALAAALRPRAESFTLDIMVSVD
jgi:DinB superfamily